MAKNTGYTIGYDCTSICRKMPSILKWAWIIIFSIQLPQINDKLFKFLNDKFCLHIAHSEMASLWVQKLIRPTQLARLRANGSQLLFTFFVHPVQRTFIILLRL